MRKIKMSKFDFLNNELTQLKQANLYRELTCIDSAQGPTVRIGNEEKILFCSNNYLNLANHPKITAAANTAMQKFGYGSGASRLISGTMTPHIQLENELAKMFSKEAALVFPSGFSANEAVLKTIGQKGDIILADKLSHASIIDAAQASPADFRTYSREDYAKIEKFVSSQKYNRRFIVTEGIFSMDGDSPDLKELVRLKNRYNAILIIDEAHAFGCIGPAGLGLAEQMGLLNEIDIIIATLSKAAGCNGGFVVSKKPVIDYLINKARAFIYTTAPAPANSAAAIAAIELIKTESWRREKLRENADYLRNKLKMANLNLGNSTSHIVPVIIGDNKKTLTVSKALFDKGFLISAIRPPTVPQNSARLRISLQCEHTKEQIDSLCEAVIQNLKSP